jgi:hypothetical protein
MSYLTNRIPELRDRHHWRVVSNELVAAEHLEHQSVVLESHVQRLRAVSVARRLG